MAITLQYERFKFQGFQGVGVCFLRVQILQNGNIVFLCAQLLDYTGTSVTNAAEAILEAAVRRLDEDNRLPSKYRSSIFSNWGRNLLRNVAEHSKWVEHYPSSDRNAEGSYALVSFGRDLKPIWNYVSLAVAAQKCGVERGFLQLTEAEAHGR